MSKKSNNSFFVLELPWKTRKEMSLSAGSFLLRDRSFPGLPTYWDISDTTPATAEEKNDLIV
jgi:hypothetical protein